METPNGEKAPAPARLSAAERQQRLEQAAEDLFARHGFLATSVEDIAHTAGVSKPAFYRHYETKHELVFALMARHRDGLAMAPLTVLTETAGTPISPQIRAMLAAWFDYLDAHPVALQLLHSRSGDATIDAAPRDAAQSSARSGHEPARRIRPLPDGRCRLDRAR